LIVLIIVPFNLINLEQAERIAKWKVEYEKLIYTFDLIKLHEGTIVPTNEEAGKLVTEEYMLERAMPYVHFQVEKPEKIENYKYKKMNGTPVKKTSRYYFDEFVMTNNGVILGFNKNDSETANDKAPLYYMFVDINGKEKPNRIGQDIFFMSVYKDNVTALGNGKNHARLKADCSPIGRGVYCSEYYLLGGSF
jgi:hypothetical protein